MVKKRILMVNECSVLSTGFSNYGWELLKRLYATDKYEIAELGTYVKQSDPRLHTIPWKVYAAQPEDDDAEGQKKYRQQYVQWGRYQALGQFGAAILDDVLLDFQPDYLLIISDAWMQTPVFDTPLRPFYRIITMPCIDSEPQRQEWLNMYENADYLLGYSDFAIKVLREQSPKIKAIGAKKLLPMPARPGVDTNIFKPLNKTEIRQRWNINPNLPIILTCMRNQQRKLFCELIDSFAKYKKDNPNDPIAQTSVLLLHSSGYDAGQEYWTHIARLSNMKHLPYYYEGLFKHILHTYMCDKCGKRTIGYAIWLLSAQINEGRAYMKCPSCQSMALRTPNSNVGYTREELAEVFNLADLYVQVSIAGACEMPASEAKACGVPILISANAALLEKAQLPKDADGNIMYQKADGTPYTMHMGGIPINIAYEFHEASTMQRRCYFDRNDLARKMTILNDKTQLAQLSKDAVFSIQDNCNYNEVAKKWMYVIDNLPAKDRKQTWDKQINVADLPQSNITIPDLPDEQFVDWCYINILKSQVDSVGRVSWINDLAQGRPRSEVVGYFINVASKDKQADIVLYRRRQQLIQNQAIQALISNPNTLQGILV